MIKRLNHISVAVPSIDDALKFYRDLLGLEVTRIVTHEERQLRIAFVKIGETEIELLEPLDDDNTVQRFLQRRGPGLHHICLEVDDIRATMDQLMERGVEFVDPDPEPGAVGQVAFILPEVGRGVLVELNQSDASHQRL
jgi:methylmalonyl-CoA epimerase